jgi:hypothetical protein
MGENLRETIATTHAETKETAKVVPVETKEESTTINQTETNAGETVKEYVSGIDISDVPAEMRTQIREKLSQKASLLEKGYQGKFKEVAELKKAIEDIQSKGMSLDEAQQAIDDFAYRKRNPTTQEKKEVKKALDSLIDSVPLDQKESLKQLRTIISEETNVSVLRKELDELKGYVKSISSYTTQSKAERINSELDALAPKYGKELIDKYRDDLVNGGLKYNVPTKKLLFTIVPDDELEQAILSKDSRQKEKSKAISSPSSGVVSIESIDTKKLGLKDVLKAAMKK